MVAVMWVRVSVVVLGLLFRQIVQGVCRREWAIDCSSNVARDAERFKLNAVSES